MLLLKNLHLLICLYAYEAKRLIGGYRYDFVRINLKEYLSLLSNIVFPEYTCIIHSPLFEYQIYGDLEWNI